MVIGEFIGLFGNRLGNFDAAIANIDAIEACKAVNERVTQCVLDAHPIASLDNGWVTEFSRSEVFDLGERMKNRLPIHFTDPVDTDGQWLIPQNSHIDVCVEGPDTGFHLTNSILLLVFDGAISRGCAVIRRIRRSYAGIMHDKN